MGMVGERTAPLTASTVNLPGYALAALSSFALVVAALGPWVSTVFFSAAGTNTPDGKITLGLGGAALLLVFARAVVASRTVMALAALCGAVGITIGIVDIVAFQQRLIEKTGADTDSEPLVPIQIGWGLWLTPIASAALVLSSIIVAVTTRRTARPARSAAASGDATTASATPAPSNATAPTPPRAAAAAAAPHARSATGRLDRTALYWVIGAPLIGIAIGLIIVAAILAQR